MRIFCVEKNEPLCQDVISKNPSVKQKIFEVFYIQINFSSLQQSFILSTRPVCQTEKKISFYNKQAKTSLGAVIIKKVSRYICFCL